VKTVLMVAFHFPPLAGSSGIQRTLRFAQQLPQFGWRPLVLSADARAYERTSPDLAAELPRELVVRRAFALDTSRHLSLRGRYVASWARPDRWISWRFDAVRQGLRLIREHRPAALWSTYPIATAHVIAAELQRRCGLPWIADFRDPMAQDGYPADPITHRRFEQIEEHALHHAVLSTFTTPGAAAEYRQRYPRAAARVRVLENGYDEESFAAAAPAERDATPLNPGAVTLLHSGIVYPSERDPTQLMAALRLLHDAGEIKPGCFKLRFRAAVADDLLHRLADEHGVRTYVEVLGAVPYRQALAEMLRADGLLVLQAANCNAQIPAKLYEYLRAGRPIVCLTDPMGDTAGVVRAAGLDQIARLDDAREIARCLGRFLCELRDGSVASPAAAAVESASRRHRSQELATLLEQVST
jgi:glycosyltransferase involved in cell wall biosynthesis